MDEINSQRYWFEKHIDQISEVKKTPYFLLNTEIVKARIGRYRSDKNFNVIMGYPIKANSSREILQLYAKMGQMAEVVSDGEIYLCHSAGFEYKNLIFNGCGKTDDEIIFALKNGLHLNIDSAAEFERIKLILKNELKDGGYPELKLGFRLNFDISAGGHNLIRTSECNCKFGMSVGAIMALLEQNKDFFKDKPILLHYHLGSQIMNFKPFETALSKLAETADKVLNAGFKISYLDVGGGLGIAYEAKDQTIEPAPEEYVKLIARYLKRFNVPVIIEAGRSTVAPAEVVVTKVLLLKENGGTSWVICDIGANALLRVAYLDWYHEIAVLDKDFKLKSADKNTRTYSIGGPLCFSGDILARDRILPKIEAGDHLVLMHTGAYCKAMMNNYCGRLFPDQYVVENGEFKLSSRSQKLEDLTYLEMK
ncbi:MAG: hypothetical protein QMC67_04425 [Candidatus Wallbacteria bacterium]